LEMEKVPEAGFKIEGLPVAGFQRKLSMKNISFFFRLWRSLKISAKIISDFQPDMAIGVGGYASGPILRAAAGKNIPVFIQEQNSYAGITNRMLAKKARKIFVAYEGMEKYFPANKIILTGNPVRADIFESTISKKKAYGHFGFEESKPVVLVIGGSLGAGTINKSILKGIDHFGDRIQLLWQTGKYYYESIISSARGLNTKNIKILPFISEMMNAYTVADIIISRAGAGTISELALVGKPVILVPSPNVAEDHQTRNARALVSKNAAIHVADSEAEEKLVKTCIDLLENKEKRKALSENIKSLALPDSANRIADEILKMI
ncbi:MAG: undecaprenyldiphospho-muramoylpentapeptide beta-N-acetylglucosaminyltransferase, partial [Bacteroidota bacterium]